MSDVSLPGLLRRIRRTADPSQRELAQARGVARSTIAAAEAGTRGLDARALAQLAGPPRHAEGCPCSCDVS